jgi:hypothetical protein
MKVLSLSMVVKSTSLTGRRKVELIPVHAMMAYRRIIALLILELGSK